MMGVSKEFIQGRIVLGMKATESQDYVMDKTG